MREKLKGFLDRGIEEAANVVTEDLVAGPTPTKARALPGTRRLMSVVKAGFLPGSRSVVPAFATMIGRALEREPAPDLDTEATDPQARFEYAREYFGRSDAGIGRATDTSYEKFLLYFVILTLLISINIASARSIGGLIPLWLDIGSRTGVMTLVAAMLFRSAFENWQLRMRSLRPLTDFLSRPAEWMAVPSPGWVTRTRGTITLLIAMSSATVGGFIVSAASTASAATSPAPAAGGSNPVATLFGTPAATDFWYQLLGYVFPQVGPIKIGQVLPIDTGIGAAFGAASAVLTAVATAFFAYQVLIGTAETAHKGSVLGDRWHTLWGPIRVSYGFGMLVPISGGYCLAQMLVLLIALAGGQLANSAWSAFVNNLNPAQISAPALTETMPLVRDVMLLEVCYAEEAHIVSSGKAVTGRTYSISGLPATWPTTYSPGPPTKNMVQRGVSNIWYYIVKYWDSSENAGVQNPIVTHPAIWTYGNCGSISGDYSIDSAAADAPVLAMDNTRLKAFDALRSSLHEIAVQVINSTAPEMNSDWATVNGPLFGQVLAAKATYDQAVLGAISTYTATASAIPLDTFQTAVTAHGWISAGAYYMALARIDAQVISLTHTMPIVQLGAGQGIDGNSEEAKLLFDKTTGVIPRLTSWWDQNVSSSSTLSQAAVNAGRFSNAGSLASATENIGSVDSGVQSWVLKQAQVKPGQGNGLQQLSDFGNVLLTICESVLVILGVGTLGATVASANPEVALLKVFKGLIPGGGMAEKVVGFAVVWTGLIAMALLIAGVLHAYILPLMPFILFTFAVMDMLVMTICGVIAAPIWAMMHINLEGEEMFKGRHGAGYMICFNILLRPVLTLFGLFLSMHLFEAMIWLLSVTIYPAMGTATAGHFFGPIGTITYVILITVLNYQVAVRSFHLITQVPQRVSSWFGASADGDGGEQHSTQALGLVVRNAEKGLESMKGAGKGAGAAGMAGGGAALPGKKIADGAGKAAGALTKAGTAAGGSIKPPVAE